MSSDIAVSVRGLSKAYNIVHNTEQHVTLAEAMLSRLKHPFRRMERETFWALKDINFDIRRGDVVGIIGRNGAGKSTLLKVLSRITEPTRGEIDIYGRIGSLLEVGTGFHPELTGRENIYLNGAILGMRRREITRQFDAIVDFAGVEKFLDTPVKRYSSGMYVRLAFAVAAHLNPEILIVDEVLAVGDAEFQKKCLGKMKDVSTQEGRTVLFVSHNMAAVRNLCNTGMLLVNGNLQSYLDVAAIIEEYMNITQEIANSDIASRTDRGGNGSLRLVDLVYGASTEDGSSSFICGKPGIFEFVLDGPLNNNSIAFTIYNRMNVPVAHINSKHKSERDHWDITNNTVTCNIENFLLAPSVYKINVIIMHGEEVLDHIDCAAIIDVMAGDVAGRPVMLDGSNGNVVLPHVWQ